MHKLFTTLCALIFAGTAAAQGISTPDAYSFSFKGINGGTVALGDYRGKVILVVNTASQCGFTPQYEDLQKLYDTYKDKGFVVLGVPSDNFAGQEPDSEDTIKKFVSEKFHVTFPMTSKTDVIGTNAHPFYVWAAKQRNAGLLTGTPRWNFHKFLIGRDGKLVGTYFSNVPPMDGTLTSAIEAALNK